jgi:hypothetical protein
MTSSTRRILRTAETTLILCFAVFTLLCWISPGPLERPKPVTICALLIAWTLTLVCSVAVWRWDRWLAVYGFVAAILWMLWSLLPRF